MINSWSSPEALFMKALATRLHDQGLRGNALVQEATRIVPHWKTYHSKPISDGALAQRADKARRYANEAPENNPRVRPYWAAAGRAVTSRKRLSKTAISKIVRECARGDAS